mmetsp:Transcript_124760/g.324104  ORF Transcript_124760/g.324104 Transcript_124760/m.324104 type:complete len:380 (+) Transcript_124760:164-1303(+)
MFLISLVLLALSVAGVPQFNVDLDVDPEERWKEVILYYKDLGAIEALTTDSSNPTPPPDVAQVWTESVESQLDDDIEGEIRGWLKYGGFNLTREHILTNMGMYEMNYPAYCSGIVAAMPNGTVVHGRNMDYSLKIHMKGKIVGWPELTVDVTFLRGGQPLMTSVTWPMQLGIHTAMRFDGWTFEQNTRRLGNDLELNTAAVQQGGLVFGLLARRVMERVPDFETAVKELWSANLAAPQYFIMTGAGPFEGAVLSMDRGGVHETSSPPLMRLNEENNTWHLLQTNDDVNGPPGDYRRPFETWKLKGSVQSQVSPEWVFSEMHGSGLKDPATVFTWVAVPATGFHRTVLPNETWAQPEILSETSTATLAQTFLAPRRTAKL